MGIKLGWRALMLLLLPGEVKRMWTYPLTASDGKSRCPGMNYGA